MQRVVIERVVFVADPVVFSCHGMFPFGGAGDERLRPEGFFGRVLLAQYLKNPPSQSLGEHFTAPTYYQWGPNPSNRTASCSTESIMGVVDREFEK